MNKIIFIPTWRCQLKCSYCDYEFKEGAINCFGRTIPVGKEKDYTDWLYALNKFSPFLLEMTGGEPTLYKDLPKLLSNLPGKCKWAVTSNTLADVSDYPANNCLCWTASYHYHSDEKFKENCYILKNKGIPLKITMVATPDNIDLLKRKIKEFKHFLIHIHPLLKQDVNWDNYPEQWKQMQKLNRPGKVKVIDKIRPAWNVSRFEKCNAGGYYFLLFPDGKVYRCYSAILEQDNLGDVENYIPDCSMKECGYSCIFPCDEYPVKKGEKNETKV